MITQVWLHMITQGDAPALTDGTLTGFSDCGHQILIPQPGINTSAMGNTHRVIAGRIFP